MALKHNIIISLLKYVDVVSDGNKDLIVYKVPIKPGADFNVEIFHTGHEIEVNIAFNHIWQL